MNKLVFTNFVFALCLAPPELLAGDATNQSSSGVGWFLTALLVIGTAVAAFWYWKQPPWPEIEIEDEPFSEQRITQTFISALPHITRELNLEIAKSWQMETLERTDTQSVLGLSLGTNRATIRTPVTYRYHIRLHDPWSLTRKGTSILVRAPIIRASKPPAIHTDQMEIQSSRGWCRTSPGQLVDQLHRDLTPTLCIYAEDSRRIGFVRETSRHSVAEFVRLWLEKENHWNKWKFTSIHVCFCDEKAMPSPADPSINRINPRSTALIHQANVEFHGSINPAHHGRVFRFNTPTKEKLWPSYWKQITQRKSGCRDIRRINSH